MTVASNTSAIITPMFVDGRQPESAWTAGRRQRAIRLCGLGPAPVRGDRSYDGGATFMVQRTTVGANQEMEPTGDVAYLTCGPFELHGRHRIPRMHLD